MWTPLKIPWRRLHKRQGKELQPGISTSTPNSPVLLPPLFNLLCFPHAVYLPSCNPPKITSRSSPQTGPDELPKLRNPDLDQYVFLTFLSRVPLLRRCLAKRYTKEHETISYDDSTGLGTVTITDHAQSTLGDVVFVELKTVGTVVEQNGERPSH